MSAIPAALELGCDTAQVRQSVRAVAVDRFVVEAVLDSYLLETAKADMDLGKSLMERMEADEPFLDRAHQAVMDALVFSTFAGTLDDAAFDAALEELGCLDDQLLEAMRQTIFEQGVQVACKSVGGSPTQGRIRRRCESFRQRVQSLQSR